MVYALLRSDRTCLPLLVQILGSCMITAYIYLIAFGSAGGLVLALVAVYLRLGYTPQVWPRPSLALPASQPPSPPPSPPTTSSLPPFLPPPPLPGFVAACVLSRSFR